MIRSTLALLVLLACSACSHSAADPRKGEDAALSQLPRAEAEARLADTLRDLSQVDEQLRSAQARRDNFELQASDDITRQNKVDAAEAELASLQTKRGALMHRQHVLEGRLRELGVGQE
jgi:hypothetical protein